MTKQEIEEIVKGADKTRYSHVVIMCDCWDYEDFARYVEIGDDVCNHIKCDPNSMIKPMEVYNLGLDLDMQLDEDRSWHIEKYVPKKEIIKTEPIKESDSSIIKENDLCERALQFATKKHEGQMRKSYTPTKYIIHPMETAKIMREYKGNSHEISSLVAASYLHDTIEDTNTTYKELVDNFGYLVASLVKEVTSNKEMQNLLGKSVYLSYKLPEMTSWAQDLKLCDRFSNVKNLIDTDPTFRTKYTIETLYILRNYIQNCKLTSTQKALTDDILKYIYQEAETNPPEEKLRIYMRQ